MSKVRWSDLFEFDDDTPISEAIKRINDFEEALLSVAKTMEAAQARLAKEYESIKQESDELAKQTMKMNLALEEEAKNLEKVAIAAERLEEQNEQNKKSHKEIADEMDKLVNTAKALEAQKKKLEQTNAVEIGSINALKAQLKEAQKAYDAMGEATDEATKAEKAEQIRTLKTQIKESGEALKETKTQAKFAAGSYFELNQRVSEAKKRLKEMEGGLDGNSKEFKQLQREIKEGSDKLKKFDEEIGDNQRKVGDYAGQIERLVPGFGMIAEGAGVADKSLLKLAMNPVGLVIIAISTALAGLAAWMKTTNEGEDALSQGMAYLTQIFNNFLKLLSVVGKYLFDVFNEPQKILDDLSALVEPLTTKLVDIWNNPMQAIKDFGKLIVDNIVNRFKAIGVAGEAIAKIFKGDLKEGFKQLADAGIQATLGIENGTDKIVNGFNAVKDAAKKTWEVLTEGTDRALELDRQADDLNSRRIANIVKSAQTELKTNKLILESKDKLNFSDAERVAKLKEYNDLILQQSKENVAIAKEELRIKEAQIRLATSDPTDEQLEEIANLRAKAIQLEAAYFNDVKKSTVALNALEMEIEKARIDRIARQKKAETDLLNTRLSAEIKVNEEIIAMEETTSARRQELLQENADKRAQMLEAQKQLELEAIDRAAQDRILNEGVEHELEILETARVEKENINKKYAENTRLVYEKLSSDLENNVFTQLAKDLDELTAKTQTESNQAAIKLAEQFNAGLISAKDYVNQRLALDEQLQGQLLKNQLDSLKAQLLEMQKYGHDVTEILQQISDTERRIAEDDANFRVEKANWVNEQWLQAASLAYQGLTDLGSQFFAAEEAKAIERRDKIEEAYARDLEMAGDNLAQREAIENAYLEKRRKAEQDELNAKRKRAQFEKAIAATQVVINTAQGIMRAVAEVPKFDFGISTGVLVGLYAALGAAQLATILARPIPAYEKGVDYSPEGWALVGEKGAEMVVSGGKAYLAGRDGAELTYLERGSKVYTANETERMLSGGAMLTTGKVFDSDVRHVNNEIAATREMINVMDEKFDSLEYTIRTKKEVHLNVTREGVELAVRNGMNWTKFLEQYYG